MCKDTANIVFKVSLNINLLLTELLYKSNISLAVAIVLLFCISAQLQLPTTLLIHDYDCDITFQWKKNGVLNINISFKLTNIILTVFHLGRQELKTAIQYMTSG